MAEQRPQRQLSAILAADVAGYSRLIGHDEEGTLARLKALRRTLIDPKISEHRGRIVKTMGDGLLVQYGSAVDAVRCAADIQRLMIEQQVGTNDDQRIEFRMGINIGDIVVDGDDIHGDGVNVAARLEGLAEPGGICVSAAVHDQVRDKLNLDFEDIGERQLKNIARPMRVLRVRVSIPKKVALQLPDRTSIAVLPFQNMSGDAEQDYFADGLTEDIITGLSRVPSLFVIARNSSFTYKGRAVEVKQVARELGVRYVLEGSIQKSGRRVRITAQLIDASTGHHIWAEKFDRELLEIFELQDEMTRNVVAATQTQILLKEGNITVRAQRADFGVWTLVNRAMARIHELSAAALAEARDLAEQATRLDPRAGAAWRALSIAVYHQAHMLIGDYDTLLADALRHAERSVELDNGDEYAHWNLGNVLVALRQHERAISALERAIEINPNYSTAWGSLGTALCYVGRPTEGIERNEIALRSDPLNPSIFFRYSGLALGHYLNRNYKTAARWAAKSVSRNRSWYLGHVYLVAANAQLARHEATAAALTEYLRLYPRATVSELERLPFKNRLDLDHIQDGLRKGRLPE